MSRRQVIVDGSNLATEGRSLPSLEQLDKAVREFIGENPDDQVTVVVDASFGHRIDPRELPTFEEAEAAGDVVSPPAGAIGRGDAFLLRIAQKTGATVLSNDSFQEFHAEHPWLFDKGRLVGGKPVPGVGWIFMERTPVRGPKSREVVKEARRRKDTTAAASRSEGSETAPGAEPAGRGEVRPKLAAAPKQRSKSVDRAIETATHEVVDPSAGGSRRRSRPPAEPVNEPLAFISFIASHPLGSLVDGVVFEYSSHGAFVEADGARCYVPLSAMGDPAPRSAREVMGKGEVVSLVVQALDPQRRGIELAMPGHEHLAGAPTAETVEAETVEAEMLDDGPGAGSPVTARRGTRRRQEVTQNRDAITQLSAPPENKPAKRAPARKAAPSGDKASAAATAEATARPAKPAKAAVRVAKSSVALDEAEPGEAAPAKRTRRAQKPASSEGSVVEPPGVAESSGTSQATKPATVRAAAKAARATPEVVPATQPAVKATPSAKAAVKVAAAKKSPVAPRRSAAKDSSEPADVAPPSTGRARVRKGVASLAEAAGAPESPARPSTTSATKATAVSKAVKAVKTTKAVKTATAAKTTTASKTTTAGSVTKKAAESVAKATKVTKATKATKATSRVAPSRGRARSAPAGS